MLPRTAQWMPKTANLYRLAIFGLLVFAQSSLALGIAALIREVGMGYLWLLTMLSLSASWWLAGRPRKTWQNSLLIFFVGVLVTFIWSGQFLGLLLDWLNTLPGLVWQILHRSKEIPLDSAAFQSTWMALQLRLATLFTDLGLWLRALASGNPTFNYTATNLVWGLAIWLEAGWAGWCQRHWKQSLVAVLPGGMLLLSVMGYTYGSTAALVILIFATLLLAAVNHYAHQEQSWQERGMDFPEARRGEIFSRFVALSLAFMLAAALIPQISIPSMIARFQEWVSPHRSQVGHLLESFGLKPGGDSSGLLQAAVPTSLPRQHLIDSGPELSKQIVMRVQIIPDRSAAEIDLATLPLYWRARTYDRYTGHGWGTSEISTQFYAADQNAQESDPRRSHQLQQIFDVSTANNFIYAAGEIISLDQDYYLAWRTSPLINETQNPATDLFAGTVEKRRYRVTSQIPAASEAELRSAPGVYPAWVTDRYLALPDSLPQRVIDLARELTRDAPTPYDKARALEAYLRTYEYQLDLPAPPKNRDLVDTFLFELQKGYCDYYASAMVVMARSIGLPARLAVGYTRGTYDPVEDQFIVTEENAHSWAEIYFEGIGWVTIEPTVAQAAIERAAPGPDQTPEEFSTPNREVQNPPKAWDETIEWLWLPGILLGLALLIGIGLLLRAAYLRWLPPSKLAIHLFRRIFNWGAHLGIPARAGETAYEFTFRLEQEILSISRTSRWADEFTSLPANLRTLAQLYVRAIFSSKPLSSSEKARLLRLWSELYRKLLLARWVYFCQATLPLNHFSKWRK